MKIIFIIFSIMFLSCRPAEEHKVFKKNTFVMVGECRGVVIGNHVSSDTRIHVEWIDKQGRLQSKWITSKLLQAVE